MSVKKFVKKLIGVFFSATILSNIIMPVFAYSLNSSQKTASDTFKISVSDNPNDKDIMKIGLGDDQISLSLCKSVSDYLGFRFTKKGKTSKFNRLANGKTKEINGALPNVSIRYKVKDSGLKEDYILHGKSAQNSFDLKYNIGTLQAEQVDEQNILISDRHGNIKTIISAPYMTDANGERSNNVSIKIMNKNGNTLWVRLTADSSWLHDDKRKYPIEIDPRYDTLPTKPMQQGDSNEQVALLKNMLFEAGIGAGVSMHEAKNDMKNNLFGSITKKFVVAFQLAMDLTPNGIADANTLAALRMHLERKGILDTQEHTEQFLRRAESRSSRKTSGFFSNLASFFGRINLTDLLVTSGTVAVVVGISAFCAPVTAAGITYMLIGGATIGAMAGGVSEYAQQRAVGRKIDFGRVAIKATGGALKGTICAIPGSGVGLVGKCCLSGGIGAVGSGENLLCNVKTSGFSRAAVEDALINGAAQGLAAVPSASLARGVVNTFKPQPQHILNSPAGTSPNPNSLSGPGKSAGLGTGAIGMSDDESGIPDKNTTAIDGSNSSPSTMHLTQRRKDTSGHDRKNLPENREPAQIDTVSSSSRNSRTMHPESTAHISEYKSEVKSEETLAKVDVAPNNGAPVDMPVQNTMVSAMPPKSPITSKERFERIRMDTIAKNQDLARTIPQQSPQYYEAQRANYQAELNGFSEMEKAAQQGERAPLTDEERFFIEVGRRSANEQIGKLNEAERGSLLERRRLQDESYMNAQSIFIRQMSTPSVQEILRFGHIVSRWQEDDGILIGCRE